jgi:hypothetical protein
VERIKVFQADWTDFLSTRKAELLRQIAIQKTMTPELTAELKQAAEQFKDMWK